MLRKRKKDSFDFHILKVAYLFQIMLFIADVGPGSTAMVNLSEYTEQFYIGMFSVDANHLMPKEKETFGKS